MGYTKSGPTGLAIVGQELPTSRNILYRPFPGFYPSSASFRRAGFFSPSPATRGLISVCRVQAIADEVLGLSTAQTRSNGFAEQHRKAKRGLLTRFITEEALRLRVKASGQQYIGELRTCRNCKKSFDSSENHPRACRFHTAHFGGETKRKFESVYTGGTLDTDGGGEITQYWHCCGSNDPFDPGCEAAPHSTYDD